MYYTARFDGKVILFRNYGDVETQRGETRYHFRRVFLPDPQRKYGIHEDSVLIAGNNPTDFLFLLMSWNKQQPNNWAYYPMPSPS